jgi:cob(I)alamin adenosyltransferase
MLKQGYIQIYTGNGKGKTTASLGVALRILGAGGKVFYAQFIKGKTLSSEFDALRKFDASFTYKSFGKGRFIKGSPAPEDIEAAKDGLSECGKALSSGNYDLVVMDELNGALKCGLFSLQDAILAINLRTSHTELIITGRNALPELIESADLVTEMTSVKHYFEQGVHARTGIEL